VPEGMKCLSFYSLDSHSPFLFSRDYPLRFSIP
jgi:hypothetical protein